jgi:hypothetical protein
MTYTFLGANIDSRPEEEKQKDHKLAEAVAAANPVTWIPKGPSEWRRFPEQDQDGSGSCVAQTIKKMALISLWLKEKVYVPFSATSIYQARSNKPAAGMIGVDAFEIWRKEGITLETLVPSQKMSDDQMDSVRIEQYEKQIGNVFKIGGHVDLPVKDIDAIASTIQTTGKGVMVWYFFKQDEWSREIPVIVDAGLTAPNGLRHSVTAVDYFLYNGKKALLVEDSAHFGGHTYHIITEDFHKVRNFFAHYAMNYVFQDQTQPTPTDPVQKPTYTFTKTLEFIPWNDTTNAPLDLVKHEAQKNDTIALQRILQYEGMFPANFTATGYYGAMTAKAVLAWQTKHAVAPVSELVPLQGKSVGPKTMTKLNSLYSQ